MSSKNFTGALVARMASTAQFAGATAALALIAPLSSAQCPTDDDMMTNDVCADAQSVAAGPSTGYVITDTSDDWYTISVPAGATIDIGVLFDNTVADMDIQLFDDAGTCANEVDDGDSVTDNEFVMYTNGTMAAVDVTLRTFLFGGTCNDYSLDITITVPPACVDDDMGTNDDCANAQSVSTGLTTGYTVSDTSEDWYTLTVADGEMIDISILFADSVGDIDAALEAPCGTSVDTSGTGTDNEELSWLNGTGASVDVGIRVFLFTGSTCNTYDLDITVAVPPCEDDDMMTNDDCASADTLSPGVTSATVTDLSDDWYTLTVSDGETLTVTANFTHADGDIDLLLEAPCGTFIDDSKSTTDSETVSWANTTGFDVDAAIAVFLYQFATSDCNEYTIEIAIEETACLVAVDDAEEENDTCMTAVTPSANPLVGAFVSKSDDDFYGPFNLLDSEQIDVLISHLHADGDIEADLLDASDCTTVLDSSTSSTDDEDLTFTNLTGSAVDVVVRVRMFSGSASDCDNYDLETTISVFVDPCDPMNDDAFEDNDTCMDATALAAGTYPGLFVAKDAADPDWYSITVPNSATIDVDLAFITIEGDVDAELFTDCVGTSVDFSGGSGNSESLSWFNDTGARQTVYIHVFVWSGDNVDCQGDYELTIDINGGSGTDFVDFCFGDGSGMACPCGNNSASGSGGGCENSNSTGAVLAASGSTSLTLDDLQFSMTDAAPDSFALLVSGVNKLNGGLGDHFMDGLRCVGGEFTRLEVRATDLMGATTSNWGSGTSLQAQFLANSMGSGSTATPLAVGQTRHFQAFYRDAVSIKLKSEGGVSGSAFCGTGLNTSQAISATMAL